MLRHKELIFRLCLFHGMLNERLEFGSLGWNKPYHFSTSDLLCSVAEMRHILEQGKVSDWARTLNYAVGELVYGGRVTDRVDKETIKALLRAYIFGSIHDPECRELLVQHIVCQKK